MNLSEIKKLIEDDGGKIIIVENGEPVMVITSFDDYKKKKLEPALKKAASPLLEAGEPRPEDSRQEEELKIEDLPF